METKKKTMAISDLIIINHDRYTGYNTALKETREEDLKELFSRLSQQSKTFSEELKKFITAEEAPEEGETKASGKLYRVWMDFRSAITDHDRKAILSSCEFGEDAAKKTYDEVLEHKENIPAEALALIKKQRAELEEGHDYVKSLRDAIE